jgi:hypothetical protein
MDFIPPILLHLAAIALADHAVVNEALGSTLATSLVVFCMLVLYRRAIRKHYEK